MTDDDWFPEQVSLPITEVLDLHPFSPKEIESLLEEYFLECQCAGIKKVRVVHGKGTGALRERVHRFCEKSIQSSGSVLAYQHPAAINEGSWGATWVVLSNGKQKSEPEGSL